MAGYRKVSLLIVAALFLVFILFGAVQPQQANAGTATPRYVATYGVDDTDCSVSDDPCLTLAYAVSRSNAGDTIHIAAGNYPTANASISKSLIIQGAGRDTTQMDGGGTTRVLSISIGPVVINDLTIEDGYDTSTSGGIDSTGANLTLNRVKVTGNTGNFGGGLYFNNGTLVINDSVFSGNTGNNGGGFYLGGTGTTTINRTAVINNQGLNNGAFQNSQSGELNVTSSTLYGNSCTGTSCNGVTSVQSVAIERFINSTITGNQSHDAAIIMNGGTCSFKNSIIALNYDGGTINDCRTPNGLFTSYGYNLRSDTDCGTAAHDIYSTSPMLGPLQDNGGLTPTVGLLSGSPAINAGPATDCPATDQRGFTRPVGDACDIGAYELQVPGAFGKALPTDGAPGLSKSVTLTWGVSDWADEYQYCVDGSDNDACDSMWFSMGSLLSTTLNDMAAGEYFWQVKAINDASTTISDSGEWWSFSVLPNPGNFSKLLPESGAVNQPKNLTLSWAESSNATDYEYCIKESGGSCTWTSTAGETSVALTNLLPAEYLWQVRGVNINGQTEANIEYWWNFTVPPAPGAFSKSAPVNAATNRPRNLTLSWGASSDAVEYQYCLKPVGGTCTWTSTGTNTSAALTGLSSAKYLWQVRAKNANGITNANGTAWWSFTVPGIPGVFGKTSPTSGTGDRPTTLTLYWGASSQAASYQYCIKKKMTDACVWKSVGSARKVTLTGLLKNTRYFWQVRAKNATGTTLANGGVFWNFTTKP